MPLRLASSIHSNSSYLFLKRPLPQKILRLAKGSGVVLMLCGVISGKMLLPDHGCESYIANHGPILGMGGYNDRIKTQQRLHRRRPNGEHMLSHVLDRREAHSPGWV